MTDEKTSPAQAEADAFNNAYGIGHPVRYWTGDRTGPGRPGFTRSAASVLGDHTAVVWVDNHSACIALSHIAPVPDQPDDIDTDSRDLPDPAAAARRVGAYIVEMGDGLYDTVAGAPLYGRDLEALCRAAGAAP